MDTVAVVIQAPQQLRLSRLELPKAGDNDLVVDVEWSGISTGTERLLWLGQMPQFPGMGYPLVPGYESVGRVTSTGPGAEHRLGEQVFVPGARCFGEIRGLFGGAASRLLVPSDRAISLESNLKEQGILLALAATAYHALAAHGATMPDRIVGHGVLGRLLARVAIAMGAAPPTVWETNPRRMQGAAGYPVIHPADDTVKGFKAIYDVSGDASLLDSLIAQLSPGGEIVLAGFYSSALSFSFPPAFMREARLRVAAEWKPDDLISVKRLIAEQRLSLDGLITHTEAAGNAHSSYQVAFDDPSCLKMILDWRNYQ